MSLALEHALVAALQAQCPRVFADVAPPATLAPYVVWHLLGGQHLTYLDGTKAAQRNALVQINVWAADRSEANLLAQQIEAALLSSPALVAEPQGELQAAYSEDTDLRGAMQDFSLWALR